MAKKNAKCSALGFNTYSFVRNLKIKHVLAFDSGSIAQFFFARYIALRMYETIFVMTFESQNTHSKIHR